MSITEANALKVRIDILYEQMYDGLVSVDSAMDEIYRLNKMLGIWS